MLLNIAESYSPAGQSNSSNTAAKMQIKTAFLMNLMTYVIKSEIPFHLRREANCGGFDFCPLPFLMVVVNS